MSLYQRIRETRYKKQNLRKTQLTNTENQSRQKACLVRNIERLKPITIREFITEKLLVTAISYKLLRHKMRKSLLVVSIGPEKLTTPSPQKPITEKK